LGVQGFCPFCNDGMVCVRSQQAISWSHGMNLACHSFAPWFLRPPRLAACIPAGLMMAHEPRQACLSKDIPSCGESSHCS
jgi:hypothetical protein